MENKLPAFVFTVAVFFSLTVQANDFEYGFRAYNANEFHIAQQTWVPLALQDNDKRAQYYLGEIFSGGMGVQLDNVQAANWYKMSARQNHTKAQTRLGALYERGQGVKKDEKKAYHWYLKAAKKADVVAQYKLAFLYAEGRGVEKNISDAYKWWGIAALWGDPYAHVEQDKIASRLTATQITALDGLIGSWKPNNF